MSDLWKVVVDDKKQTELTGEISLHEAERELCRACNDGVDAYLVEAKSAGETA